MQVFILSQEDSLLSLHLESRSAVACQGFDGTTRDLAWSVAGGTLFRHFANKSNLIEVATQGWVEILTDFDRAE